MSILNVAIKVCVLMAGIYIGTTIVHVPYFELDKEVNIIELGNLVAIPILALLIPVFLTKKLDDKKCSKDLLISELRVLCDNLSKINASVKCMSGRAPNPDEFVSILSDFKSARVHFNFIKEQAKELDSLEVKSQIETVDEGLEGYWKIVTGNEGIKVRNFIASRKFIWKQSLAHNLVAAQTKKLMFAINNY